MGAKHTVYLISGGTNYYLSGGGTVASKYNGSGTPWTVEATTPYELALNDATGNIWVAQPAPGQVIYGGGPPFRNGRTPLYRTYDTLQETIGLQLRATSKNNAIALLRQLRQILNTALYSNPCVLAVQGGTNTAYFEIYAGDVSESALFLSEPDGFWRTTVTWTRSPHGGLLSTGETLINAATFTNTGTGANNNTQAFSAGSGDLIYEGQPLNVSFKPANVASDVLSRAYFGSVLSRTYSTTGAGTYSTSASAWTRLVTLNSFTLTSMLTNVGVRPRVCMRCSSLPSSILQLRVSIEGTGPSGTLVLWSTPAQIADSWFIDFGPLYVDFVRRAKGLTAPTLTLALYGRSTDGTSGSVVYTYTENILYYDWCRVDTNINGNNSDLILIDSFAEQTSAPCLPYGSAQSYDVAAGGTTGQRTLIRGRAPRYFSGASLYAEWQDGTSNHNEHTTTRTAAVTVTHAPLYQTVRGAS